MKHEYDQNVHVHFGQKVLYRLRENFLFIVNSEAKETFSTPKND